MSWMENFLKSFSREGETSSRQPKVEHIIVCHIYSFVAHSYILHLINFFK